MRHGSLLANGLSDPPESRATKGDLEKEIRHYRKILSEIRSILISIYARELEIKADP